jgi:hypothetical protein
MHIQAAATQMKNLHRFLDKLLPAHDNLQFRKMPVRKGRQ